MPFRTSFSVQSTTVSDLCLVRYLVYCLEEFDDYSACRDNYQSVNEFASDYS